MIFLNILSKYIDLVYTNNECLKNPGLVHVKFVCVIETTIMI